MTIGGDNSILFNGCFVAACTGTSVFDVNEEYSLVGLFLCIGDAIVTSFLYGI